MEPRHQVDISKSDTVQSTAVTGISIREFHILPFQVFLHAWAVLVEHAAHLSEVSADDVDLGGLETSLRTTPYLDLPISGPGQRLLSSDLCIESSPPDHYRGLQPMGMTILVILIAYNG